MEAHEGPSKHKLLPLSLAALGIVYGDIATSPLYALSELFFGHGGVAISFENVAGAVSLALWALILIISCKYLGFVLMADNDGQGGVYALYAILHRYRKHGEFILLFLLILSAGMLFGSGIITPAISVLAAVEGLKIATPHFEPYIIPIAVCILLCLFYCQRFGTSRVGAIFGPIMMVWLLAIAALGVRQIVGHPEILKAFNPMYGYYFLSNVGLVSALLVIGAVMLVITGGEALYADLGHFGIRPIRWSWFSLVLPCLMLNYLGQGAILLSGAAIKERNIFYSMVPSALIVPMVLLATCAAIIASQALISGAFSLTMQAVGLNLFPRVRIIHTHESHQGQIYVPFTNWALCLGSILLVYTFRSSSALASAYGLAVSADMLTTSLSMISVSHRVWKWPVIWGSILFGAFALVDFAFVGANSLRFFEGGYVPIVLGLLMFCVMQTWSWGRTTTFQAFSAVETLTVQKIIELKKSIPAYIDRTVILMCPKPITRDADRAPVLLQHYVDRYGSLPKHLILFDVHHRAVPYIHGDRYTLRKFYDDPEKGSIASVTVHFGFMETPDVEAILEELAQHKALQLNPNPQEWHVHASIERMIVTGKEGFLRNLMLRLFALLRQNSLPAYYFYGLGKDVKLSIEVFPIRVS